MFFLFFFFKQKTAYEMRISDWSSDVCSSDLQREAPTRRTKCTQAIEQQQQRRERQTEHRQRQRPLRRPRRLRPCVVVQNPGAMHHQWPRAAIGRTQPGVVDDLQDRKHTSELQSLMRISYAVFCLKKKKNHTN